MKLKQMLQEDMGKFSDIDFIISVQNYFIKSEDSLFRLELIKLIKEFIRRKSSIEAEVLNLLDLGEIF